MMKLPEIDEYTRTVYAIVSPLRWGRIVEAIARKAEEEGDLQAARFLLPYFRARSPAVTQLKMSFYDDPEANNG
jgi:hypothetical protein